MASSSEKGKKKKNRRMNYLDNGIMEKDLGVKCSCGDDCMTKVDIGIMRLWRTRLQTFTEGSARQVKLIELMQSMSLTVERKQFVVNGEIICRSAWLLLLKVSTSTFYRALHLLEEGWIHDPCNVPSNGKGLKGMALMGFIDDYLTRMGDICPESGRLFLPCCMSASDVYTEFCANHIDEKVSHSYFSKIWHRHYSHVSFPRVTRMTKCNVCIAAKAALAETDDPEAKLALIRDRDEHLKRQWMERKLYYQRKAEAMADPKKLSLILDGMDQAKTNLPHFKGWSAPKDCDRYRLQTHLEGCLVHGSKFFAYVVLEDVHDTNMVLNCLLESLVQESKDGVLPPSLYIQLDNCWRENKNRFFISFMGYLVATRIFEMVHMSFLMVGHTHEDIDQRFSCISRTLKKENAKTLPQLLNLITASMPEMAVQPSRLGRVFDIKTWIEPFINDISQHSVQHAFRLTRMETGNVALHFKQWNQDENWLPLASEEQYPVFKTDVDGRVRLPDGEPNLRDATYEKQHLDIVRRNITSAAHHITNADDREWWRMFFENPLEGCPRVGWHLNKLKPQPEVPSQPTAANASAEDTPSVISPFLEKERQAPRVISRRTICRVPARNVGKMVLTDEKKVGKVLEEQHEYYTIAIFKGKKNSTWTPALKPNGQEMTERVLKSDILCDFQLTPGFRLPGTISVLI